MDPELERIAANIGKIIDQGGPESDVLAYLRSEGFASQKAWLDALQPKPANTGQTPPLPFNNLPPMAGGALDALVAFGSGFGVPMLSRDTREYMAGLDPAGKKLMGAAAGVVGGAAASPLFAARAAATGPYQVATGSNAMQAIPSIAGQAARTVGGALGGGARALGGGALGLLRSRVAQMMGAGAVGAVGSRMFR